MASGSLIELPASGGSSIIVAAYVSPGAVAVDKADNIFYNDRSNSHGAVLRELTAGGELRTIAPVLNDISNLSTDNAGNLYVSIGGDGSGSVLEIQLGAVDFKSINVCSASATTPAPCTNSITLDFNVDANSSGFTSLAAKVVTQGGASLDYTATSNTCTGPFPSSGSCSVTIQFAPLAPGTHLGAVDILGATTGSPAPSSQATVYLHGIGTAPLLGFEGAGLISTLPITFAYSSYVYGIALDGLGNLYVSDDTNCLISKYTVATGVTSVVGGNGTCSSSAGDNGPATSATLRDPHGLAVDGRGNLYIADYNGHVIRKIDALTGIITRVAGTGVDGYTPDGGLAVNSPISEPWTVAVDQAGNLYYSDFEENLVRRVDARTGILTTVVGNHNNYYAGFGGDGGAATSAYINEPASLVFDSANNLYFADSYNDAIRKVAFSTGIITTVAGKGGYTGYSGDGSAATSAEMDDPIGLAIDAAENLYIADSNNIVVRKVRASTGIISTVAGNSAPVSRYAGDGGPANLAGLWINNFVVVDGGGNLYISEPDNSNIRKVTVASGIIPNYGSDNVGTSSAAADVTAANNGNATLDLSALVASTNFNLSGSDTSCTASSTVAAGASCVLGIKFLPTAAGALTGTITLTDDVNNNPTSSQSIALSGTGTALASQLVMLGVPPTTIVGGNLGTITVSVEASNSTIVTGSTASITATITGPNDYSRIVTVTAVNGVATFNLSAYPLKTAGIYKITASSTGLTPASATSTVIASQVATQLALAGVPPTIASGGNLGTVTVSVEASSGAIVTGSTASVTATITGPSGYSQTVTGTAVNGVATFNLNAYPLTTAGTYTVTASSTGLTPASASSIVTAVSVATKLALAGVPPTIAAGGNLGTVTVSVEASSGAIVTGSTASVTATITGPSGYSQTVTGTAVNGVATFNLTAYPLTTAGTYTVTASSTGLTPASATSTVTAAQVIPSATQMAVSAVPASVSQGGNLGTVTATLETASGGVVTSPATTVTLTITGPGSFSATVHAVTVNGVATFDMSGISLSTPGSYSVVVSSPGLPSQTFPVALGQDFTLAPAPGSTSGSSIVPTQTVQPGSPAVYPLVLAPAGTIFNAPITLSATGLPPGATYTFSPAAITPGSASAATTLTVQTAKTTAALDRQNGLGGTLGGLALATLLLPFASSRKLRRAAGRMPLRMVAFTLLSIGAALGLTGCGVGGLFGHPPSTYTITVTGTSGSLSHSTTVNLTIQ